MTTSADIREFKIDIPNEEVERLKRKLNDTRLPGREIVPDAGTLYDVFLEPYLNLPIQLTIP
jgi:hypothetical protein